MEADSSEIVIDAVQKNSSYNKNAERRKLSKKELYKILNSILEQFTIDEYKSMCFLLIDKLGGVDEFLAMAKTDIPALKCRILKMELTEDILIELFGTLKMYKALDSFQTCFHIFKVREQNFKEIEKIWKVLYALCEEMTEDDLESLRLYISDIFEDHILSAEEWFAVAMKYNIISKYDLSKLKLMLKDYPKCLDIIDAFENPELETYHIKNPTHDAPCGIALILNFAEFDDTQKTPRSNVQLTSREGSTVDVDSLKKLWETFGFETVILENLSESETFYQLNRFAMKDHTNYDAFICCVLSHGNSNVFYTSDCQEIRISNLITIISKNGRTLENKPKLFFIQACQGTKVRVGTGNTICNPEVDHEPLDNILPADTDICAVVATINGYVSFRDTKEGTLFIQSLCKVMKKYGHNYSILDVVTHVTGDVSQTKVNLGPGKPNNAIQIVPTYTTLRKKLTLKKKDCLIL